MKKLVERLKPEKIFLVPHRDLAQMVAAGKEGTRISFYGGKRLKKPVEVEVSGHKLVFEPVSEAEGGGITARTTTAELEPKEVVDYLHEALKRYCYGEPQAQLASAVGVKSTTPPSVMKFVRMPEPQRSTPESISRLQQLADSILKNQRKRQ